MGRTPAMPTKRANGGGNAVANFTTVFAPGWTWMRQESSSNRSITPCNRCVRFVAVVTAGSRNTHYRAACYSLLGPVFHRLDRASHTGAFGSTDYLGGST